MAEKDQPQKYQLTNEEVGLLSEQLKTVLSLDDKDPRKKMGLEHLRKQLGDYEAPESESLGSAVLGKIFEGLDYGGGLALRTPIGLGIESVGKYVTDQPLSGESGPQIEQDFKDAAIPFEGKPARSMGSYLERAGFPPGPELSKLMPDAFSETGEGLLKFQKGGLIDVTPRGAAGFVGDLLTTPSMWKKGIQGVMKKLAGPQSANALRAADQVSRKAGPMTAKQKALKAFEAALMPEEAIGAGIKKYYKGAFREADELARESGKLPVSSVAWDNNLAGGSQSALRDNAASLTSQIHRDAQGIVKNASELAPTERIRVRDIYKPVINDLEAAAEKSIKNPKAYQSVAKALQAEFDAAFPKKSVVSEFSGKARRPDIGLEEASDLASEYQQAAKLGGRFKPGGPLPKNSQRGVKQAAEHQISTEGDRLIGTQARRVVEDVLDGIQPGLGGKLYSKNQQISSLLTGEKAMTKKAKKSFQQVVNENAIPGALVASAGAGAYMAGVDPKAAALASVLTLLGGSTAARTYGGLGMKYANKLTPAVRAGMAETVGTDMRKPTPFEALEQALEQSTNRKPQSDTYSTLESMGGPYLSKKQKKELQKYLSHVEASPDGESIVPYSNKYASDMSEMVLDAINGRKTKK